MREFLPCTIAREGETRDVGRRSRMDEEDEGATMKEGMCNGRKRR